MIRQTCAVYAFCLVLSSLHLLEGSRKQVEEVHEGRANAVSDLQETIEDHNPVLPDQTTSVHDAMHDRGTHESPVSKKTAGLVDSANLGRKTDEVAAKWIDEGADPL